MNKEKQKAYLQAARKIADQLDKTAKRDEKGLYWETLSFSTENQADWQVTDGLYNGVSGIALFYMELFQQTKEDAYLQTAKDAMTWVVNYARETPPMSAAYFTGRLGSALALVRLAEITEDRQYLDQALVLARAIEDTPDAVAAAHVVDDLLNGIAGTALGFLHLHAATGEDWILEAVDRRVGILLDHAEPGIRGFCWDRSPQNIRGLCGFSHGAAGMGFAFIELGAYLDNPALTELGRQAFAYETHYFDEKNGSWPDFRKGIFSAQDRSDFIEAYKHGKNQFFTQPKFMDAWCHGAPGIGLARIRAYERLGEDLYLDHYNQARQRTAKKSDSYLPDSHNLTFTLCHGVCGDTDTFLEGYRVLRDPALLENGYPSMDETLERLDKESIFYSGYMILHPNPEDTSLFMGNAGIGYAFLRWSNPDYVPSILSPLLVGSHAPEPGAYPNLSLSTADLHRRLLSHPFERTIDHLETLAAEAANAFFAGIEPGGDSVQAFRDFISQQLNDLSGSAKDRLADIFKLENAKLTVDLNCPSLALVQIRQVVHAERMAALEDRNNIGDQTLVLDPGVSFEETKENWTDGPADESEPEPTRVLLKALTSHVMEVTLNDFTYLVLESFREPAKVQDVVTDVSEAFELDDESQREQVNQLIQKQIQEALDSGLLLFPESQN